jgi:tetratricopeptide (TPR) repeat protein
VSPERWQQVKVTLANALEQPSESERAAFLENACGDDTSLRREVESLLAQPDDDFDSAAAVIGATKAGPAATGGAGRQVGDYELVRELGRGGMGSVWLARRADQQFEKVAAIKLLKRGTDTDEVVRRFQAERQILARLEHPNIARLLDGGVTDEGLPYFVMEYVEGEPVTDYCREHALTVEERLRLFLKICGAVQFAHQNLVVHRDLKPGNILVTAEGEPKLLDFGIAKLLAADEVGLTVTLAEHQRLTPAYASPEQVRGEPVSTVSDVYTLGTLLYEILTGKKAHRFSVPRPPPTELFRVVVQEEPLRPSVAAGNSNLGPSRTGISRNSKFLKGDLDNIILKALQKEPARRYSGVGAFATDIQRYLANKPVAAHKDTVVYRTSKFVRRNRLGVAAGVLIGLAVAIGSIVAAWEAHVARLERRKAERRFNEVRELAHSVLFEYHDAIATLPGSTAIRQKLVQDALRYLDKLGKEAGNDPGLLRELASAYEKIAAVQGGAATSSKGTLLTASNLGDTKGAIESSLKALVARERILQMAPDSKKDLQALVGSYEAVGSLYLRNGPPDKAVEYHRKAIPLIESLLARNPGDEELLYLASLNYSGLSKALGDPGVPNLGDTKGALEFLRKALEVDETLAAAHPENLAYQQGLGNDHNALGLIFSATGQRKEQLEQYQMAVSIGRRLVAADPRNTLFRRELAVQIGNVGSVMVQLKDKPGALPYFREALAIYEALVAADPSDASVRRQLALGYRNVGVALGATDQTQALRSLQKAQQIFADLVATDPKNDDFRRQWAYTHLATSRFEAEIGDFAAAVTSASEGIRIDEGLVADSPANASARNTLGLLYLQLAASHTGWASKPGEPSTVQVEQWQHAKDAFTRSLAIYQEMKTKGILSPADATKPDEIAAELAKCESALSSLGQDK